MLTKQTIRNLTEKWQNSLPNQIKSWSERMTSNTHANTSPGLGSLLGLLDWDNVRSEVDRECRARIAIVGGAGVGKSMLLNRIIGAEMATVQAGATCVDKVDKVDNADDEVGDEIGRGSATHEDFGLFSVIRMADPNEPIDVSAASDNHDHALMMQSADLIVWILDGTVGLRPWEHEQLCRVRAMSQPLLVVVNKCDEMRGTEEVIRIGKLLAQPVFAISAQDGAGVIDHLLPAMVSACPHLVMALGREVPAWRKVAVQQTTQRAAVLSGLAGLEPVPLLDIPFQVLIQMRLMLRIAAMFGEPVGDRYSRELMATLIGGAGLRYLAQQLAKLVPLVGWVISGALAWVGTCAIGRIAAAYFENGRSLSGRWPSNQTAQRFDRLRWFSFHRTGVRQ